MNFVNSQRIESLSLLKFDCLKSTLNLKLEFGFFVCFGWIHLVFSRFVNRSRPLLVESTGTKRIDSSRSTLRH